MTTPDRNRKKHSKGIKRKEPYNPEMLNRLAEHPEDSAYFVDLLQGKEPVHRKRF